ncbi:FecR domain-containing protein [Oxalobacteraceae bacterium OTU3CINTB1]|nr:FecR domain-containing protein [Oxalobacteraceae bacterium OTU3CINTB1]
MSSVAERPLPPEVALRAVEWLVDLQAENISAESLEALRRWRAAHPDHERAWQRIESVNGKFQLAASVQREVAHAALTPPSSARRRKALASLTVLLFAGGVTWTVRDRTRWAEWTADQRTATGERRTITLADGGTLALNSGSAVNIAYTASERRVRLIAGEILVSTAKDAGGRPFLIETDHGIARALGTRYAVRLLESSTDVAVYAGAVRVEPRAPGAPSRLLGAGARARFTFNAVGAHSVANPDSIAWTDGFIVAKSMRLGDFLSELSRYSALSMSCAPEVAHLRVSGSYPLADIDRVLETLAALLSLRIETVTRFWGLQTVGVRFDRVGRISG